MENLVIDTFSFDQMFLRQMAGILTGQVLVVLVVLLLVIVPVHIYVAGSVLQCPPVQVAVMMSLGNKPSSQVKVMDDHSNVVVWLCITTPSPATGGLHSPNRGKPNHVSFICHYPL